MDQNSSLGVVYDFNSQAGITAILMAIRTSELSSPEKNELRDLVLLFINGGRDETVRISLEQKLNIHNIKPLPPKQKNSVNPIPAQNLPFGNIRPTPSFSAPNSTINNVASPVTPPNEPIVVAEPTRPAVNTSAEIPVSINNSETTIPNNVPVPQAPEPVTNSQQTNNVANNAVDSAVVQTPSENSNPVQVSAPAPTTAPTPVLETQVVPKPEPVVQTAPVVAPVTPEPIPTSAAPAPNPTPEPSPVNVTQNPVQANPPQFDINTNYLDRIREIKQNINSKVGNPVNLIDIDNVAGREYMNALLDAMKKVNGGVGGIDIAMQRLELAYSAVETAIKNHQTPAPTENTVSNDSAPVTSAPQTPEVTANVVQTPIPVTEPQAKVAAFSLDPVITPVETKDPQAVGSVPLGPLPEIKDELSGFEDNANQSTSNENSAPVSQPEFTPTPIPTPQIVNSSVQAPTSKIPSLADEKKSLTISDIPETLPRTPEEMSNPLFSKEIDDGLEQLLSDWPLFKKSGLFGTGPKGREHPLFKKISGLQIPLLLAGRFEGSTQDIKQSITDYMNGWRYEQGIIYEQGETFEMYLRRVIKHIIDLQNKRNQA